MSKYSHLRGYTAEMNVLAWDLFGTYIQRRCTMFVRPRFRETSSFCTAEQMEQNLISLVNEFDYIMSGFFLPDGF